MKVRIAAPLALPIALIAAAFTAPAFAQQAEWLQNYDAGPRNSVLRSSTPMLSPETLQATEQAIVAYRDLAARGGWQPVQLPDRLGLGARGPAVAALRQRLAITGDLVQKAGESNVYGSYVEAAVRQGWDAFIGSDGLFVGMHSFGASAPIEALYPYFGITADAAAEAALKRLGSNT